MPNYTSNSIFIEVPKDRAVALQEALRGPAYHWAMDGAYNDSRLDRTLSNHEVLSFSKGTDIYNAAREAYLSAGMPEWMEIGVEDVRYYKERDGDISDHTCVQQIPISLVRHRPWSGPEEYAAQRENLLNFQYAAFGCKWSLNFDVGRNSDPNNLEAHDVDDFTFLTAYCETANGYPSEAPAILQPVLAQHSARMIWLYVDEGNEGAGCFQIEGDSIEVFEEDDPPLMPDPDDDEYETLDEPALAERLIEQGASEDLIREVLEV
jgi:hypothetical protein